MVVVVGIGAADRGEEHGRGVEVHELGHVEGLHQAGGHQAPRWLGGRSPGSRKSTYEIPEYKQAAASFADATLQAMLAAPIDNPGTTKRPGLPGVQYVGVPEFQDVGTRCTQEISAAIAGNQSIDDGPEQVSGHRFVGVLNAETA